MNPSCQHYRIDNETWQCEQCSERMVSQVVEVETMLSAPNAAACTNPNCSGDVDDPNCDNPHGIYVPDRSRAREVIVGRKFTYKCERCQCDGMIITADSVIWECGKVHRGVPVAVKQK